MFARLSWSCLIACCCCVFCTQQIDATILKRTLEADRPVNLNLVKVFEHPTINDDIFHDEVSQSNETTPNQIITFAEAAYLVFNTIEWNSNGNYPLTKPIFWVDHKNLTLNFYEFPNEFR